MCGIFGFYLKHPLTDQDIDLGKAGIKALEHRGPDNQDVWFDKENGIFLGHARLSIIDVSEKSNQPMHSENNVISYNGELYNYKEIAQTLSGNYDFKTSGDTEILLQAWEKNGPACLNSFDGMFAFAIWEKKQHKLHLVNDFFGEKPLYWTQKEDGIYFSSEPQPLVDLLKIPSEFSEQDMSAFLSFGFMPGKTTGFKSLNILEAASHLTINHDGALSDKQYWTPKIGKYDNNEEVNDLSESDLDEINHCFIESLKRRFRSDVPLGLFLSSGVDSALIAAVARKELGLDVQCLTVKFSDEEVKDESSDAKAIADYLKLPHKIINSAEDPARQDPKVIYDLFGEANINITIAAAYQMSLAAKKEVSVALTGIGGDELFYGYNKYHDLYNLETAQENTLKNLIKSIVGKTNPLAKLNNVQKFLAMKNIAYYAEINEVLPMKNLEEYFENIETPSYILGRYFDLKQTMPFSYIQAMERASMRASLELRTPYLQKELFDLMAKFDARCFLKFGKKHILRRLLKRYLPLELFDHPKNGFQYPLQPFLQKQTPKIDLPNSWVEDIWQKKNQKGYEVLASRLQILEHFSNL